MDLGIRNRPQVSTGLLLLCWDCAKLLHHGECVEQTPMFNGLSARHAHNVDTFHVNLLASCRHVHEGSFVSSFHGGSDHNFFSSGENVVNSNMQVWKWLSKSGHALLETFNPGTLARKRIMFHEVRGHEFIRSRHVAFIENFFHESSGLRHIVVSAQTAVTPTRYKSIIQCI